NTGPPDLVGPQLFANPRRHIQAGCNLTTYFGRRLEQTCTSNLGEIQTEGGGGRQDSTVVECPSGRGQRRRQGLERRQSPRRRADAVTVLAPGWRRRG